MTRLVAALLVAWLTLSACSGGDDHEKPSLPLPDKAPSARGPATGPELEPKVLLAAADELDSTLGDVGETHVERRSGAFISGTTVVGYSVDDVSGYDVGSGEELWTAKLDMGGGTVCFASQPDRDITTFTVVYGKEGFCTEAATISVADGKVLSDVDMMDATGTLDGETLTGRSIDYLFTVKKTDYLVDHSGVVWKQKDGEWTPATELEESSYFNLYPTPDGTKLIGSRLGSDPTCYVDAYELPSFEPIWTKGNDELFPGVGNDCTIALATGNPAWMTQQDGTVHHMIQVDPKSGEVLGSIKTDAGPREKAPKDKFDASVGSLYFDTTLGLADGDMIFAQARGISRYSLADDALDWSLDLSQFELESDHDYPTTTVLPQGLTKDGYLVATVSNDTAAELVAVEARTGKLVGRWPVPAEYRNGFQVDPHLTLFADGIVLTRNFEAWNYAFDGPGGVEAPAGDRFDIGVFAFPDPNVKKSGVPTAGPTDVDATWLGGVKAAGEDFSPIGDSVGDMLIVDRGPALVALDSSSGKQAWSADLPAGADICSRSEPDGKSTAMTVVFSTGGEDAECRSVVRIGLKKGTLGEPIQAGDGAAEFFGSITFRGQDYLTSVDGRVDKVTSDGLQGVGDLGRGYTHWLRTPEDPTLLIAADEVKGGEDWVIDAYRLPAFEKVWSIKASDVLGKIDKRNPVDLWRANALWLSTTIGDINQVDKGVDDVLVHLDAATGEVAWTSDRVKRDYLADDPEELSLISASSSSWYGVGLEDGSLIIEQPRTIARYSPDGRFIWATDVTSIRGSMERSRNNQATSEQYALIDKGKTVLVALSNGTSVEFMTLSASKGKITGRWKVPTAYRNGLQAWPDVVAVKGGVALLHSRYGWTSEFGEDTGREPPSTTRYDIGFFALGSPDDD